MCIYIVHIVFAEFLSILFFIFCATLRVLDILIISLIIFCGVFAVICVIAICLCVAGVVSTRRCFGFVSMVFACWLVCDLLLSAVWCKFISCCSARLVLLFGVD